MNGIDLVNYRLAGGQLQREGSRHYLYFDDGGGTSSSREYQRPQTV